MTRYWMGINQGCAQESVNSWELRSGALATPPVDNLNLTRWAIHLNTQPPSSGPNLPTRFGNPSKVTAQELIMHYTN